jgi:hypothetical protein
MTGGQTFLSAISCAVAYFLATATAHAGACENLSSFKIAAGRIDLAQSVTAGAFTPPKLRRSVPVAFCRVAGTLTPTTDSDIKFELWLPLNGWTGRYESVGNGGFAGAIRYDSMTGPVIGGSAVASTDDGHSAPAVGPGSASWALGHPQKVIDYGYRAVHLTALAGKAITAAFYAKPPHHSYFAGCSKGGQEAFMEAQRYPNDFDGIIAGAAANRWTDMFSSFSWSEKINLASPAAYISKADVAKIAATVLGACDSLDGVKDGLVSDPLRCRVEPSEIDLTSEQRRTLAQLYAGPVGLYPGQARGGEGVQWASVISGPSFEAAASDAEQSMYGDGFFANFLYQDPSWTFRRFELDKTPALARAKLGSVMNSDSTDLSRFEAHGGKLIQFHGWADAIVTPLGGIEYYEKVAAARAARSRHAAHVVAKSDAMTKMQGFYRLFLAPGMGHCGGGPGPNSFGQQGGDGDGDHDLMVALEEWVEKGVAPQRILASRFSVVNQERKVLITRPLCAFPRVAVYVGAGNPNVAENFTCKAEY